MPLGANAFPLGPFLAHNRGDPSSLSDGHLPAGFGTNDEMAVGEPNTASDEVVGDGAKKTTGLDPP